MLRVNNLRLNVRRCHHGRVPSDRVAQRLDDEHDDAKIPGGREPNIAARTSGSARPMATAGQSKTLPPDLQALLREAITGLEIQIWDASDRETADGIACDIGSADCSSGHTPSHMTLVPVTPADEVKRKRLLVDPYARLDTPLRARMCDGMEPGIGAFPGHQGRRRLSRRTATPSASAGCISQSMMLWTVALLGSSLGHPAQPHG